MSPFELALPETTNRQLLVDLVGVEHLRESQFQRFRQLLSARRLASSLTSHGRWLTSRRQHAAAAADAAPLHAQPLSAPAATSSVLSFTTTHHDAATARSLSSAALVAAGALLSRTRELAIILGIDGSCCYSIVSRRPSTTSTVLLALAIYQSAGRQARR